MLVFDRSSSISGRKLEDAKLAAKTFVGQLALTQDRIGVVTFAEEARLDLPLTNDQLAVEAVIDVIVASDGTNIAAGIDTAYIELSSGGHNPAAIPVMLLLSDGRDNAGESVQASADLAKAHGIRIITIGLGRNANQELLRAMASSESDYYYTASSADLAAIYDTIARGIHNCGARGQED
jgi:Ca-activated chloride channel family protein